MTIMRGTITYTFMFDTNVDSEDSVRQMSLARILDECDTEHMLGEAGELVIEAIPNEEVAAAEIAMGCDGTFFADPDELQHARLDAEK